MNLRYTIPLDNIKSIQAHIESYRRMISFYESWLEENGEYDFVHERILHLTNDMVEYMIAEDFAKKGARVFGEDNDVYKAAREQFEKHHPNLAFPFSGL